MAGTDFNELLGAETRIGDSGLNSTLMRGGSQVPSDRVSLTNSSLVDLTTTEVTGYTGVIVVSIPLYFFVIDVNIPCKALFYLNISVKNFRSGSSAASDQFVSTAIYELLNGTYTRITSFAKASTGTMNYDGVSESVTQEGFTSLVHVRSLTQGQHTFQLRIIGSLSSSARFTSKDFGYVVLGQ